MISDIIIRRYRAVKERTFAKVGCKVSTLHLFSELENKCIGGNGRTGRGDDERLGLEDPVHWIDERLGQ